MEDLTSSCYSCGTKFPTTGCFCGKCLTQIKCKSCESILEKDFLGCTNCGTPKISVNNSTVTQNTFKMHQTLTDRIIEATFSDNIGKEIADMLKETYSNNLQLQSSDESDKIKSEINSINEDETLDINFESLSDNNSLHQAKVIIKNSIKDLPTLMAINIKNLPSSEVEWIVIYSFYASNFGKDIYSRKSIIDSHKESKRKSNSFLKNLTRHLNLAINQGYINPLHEGYFLIDKGVTKANEIINRTSGTLPKTHSNITSSRKAKAENTTHQENKPKKIINNQVKALKRIQDLNLEPDNMESLKATYNKFPCKNDHERNLIFTYYLQEVLNIDNISPNHFYTCYDYLNLRTSENLPQGIRNTRNKTGWIIGENGGTILTMKGRNKIKFWNLKE